MSSKSHAFLLSIVCFSAICVACAMDGARATTCYGDPNCSLGTEPYTFGPNDLFGGGSSLGAPYWRQISDCYADPADLITAGSPLTYVDELLFDYKGRSAQNCQTMQINPGPTAWFVSTGSGNGILGLFGHDPIVWGSVNEADGDQFFPTVTYALSGIGLSGSDLAAYDEGTGQGGYCQGTNCINIAPPVGGPACNSGSTDPYPNPLVCYGPLVQFPVSIDPLAIAYANAGTYEKVSGPGKKEIDYHFNVQNGSKYGGLRLSVLSLCAIYNGLISNWNDPQLTADNGNVSLEDPKDPTPPENWTVFLEPVGRSDTSGSTLTFTRHLADVCADFTFNMFEQAATTLEGAGVYGITEVANSAGMAGYVAFTRPVNGQGNRCPAGTKLPAGYSDCIQQGRVGYIGADYVLPYVSANGTDSFGLFAAELQNLRGEYVSPSPEAALVAFREAGLPPQTDTRGDYCANCGSLMRNNPADWNPQALLGDPIERGAYPMVGTTNYLAYTCYADGDRVSNLVAEITYVEKAPINTAGKGILESSGLSPLPMPWRKAVEQSFITNSDGLGLGWSVAGSQGTAACQDAVGG